MPSIKYNFNAEEDGEVSVKIGEEVSLVPSEETFEGWILIRKLNGVVGFVPKDYVDNRVIEPITKVVNQQEVRYVESPPIQSIPPIKPDETFVSENIMNPTPNQIPTPSSTTSKPKSRLDNILATRSLIQRMKENTPTNRTKFTNTAFIAHNPPQLASPTKSKDFINPLDEIDELIRANDQWLERTMSSQVDSFNNLIDSIDSLSKRLVDITESTQEQITSLVNINDIIDNDRKTLKQQVSNLQILNFITHIYFRMIQIMIKK